MQSESSSLTRWPDVVEEFPDLAPTYDAMSKNLDAMRENTKQYYRWMAAAMKPWLGKRTMEVGAGPGLLTAFMSDFDYYLITETWAPYLADLRRIAGGRPGVEIRDLDVGDLNAQRSEFRSLQLDSIFSTNMLEHIKDDVAVLRDMGDAVGPGRRVVNLVPAYRYLYGDSDRVIGHFRRYEPAELRAKMELAGLIVERIIPFNQAGVFSWLLINKVLRRQNASDDQYALFDRFVPFFRLWENVVRLPVGLSLIGVGRTPGP